MKKRKYELVPIDRLIPYENNARTHSEDQINKIVRSIEEFGFINPILIDADFGIIAGHGRVLASKKMGITELPCLFIEDLTETQKRAYILADNKLTLDGGWNDEILRRELAFLDAEEFDFTLTGFDDFEFEEQEINFKEIDCEIKEQEPKSKRGQIYKLGEHRLMVGDSTNQEDVNKLMNGEVADLLFTDPPYNVNVSNSQGMTIENDNLTDEEFFSFLSSAFKCASSVLKFGGGFYVWLASKNHIIFETALKQNGLATKQELIWVKDHATLGRQDYKWKHEPCLYGWKEGAGHYFCEEYNHPTVIEDKVDINKLSKQQLKVMISEILQESLPTTVIYENKPLKNDLHPTMKPIKLCGGLIKNSTKKNDLVIDLFGGSGSTLIACEQLQRKCYTMEYEPKYADAIIQRWETMTGKKVELINE